MKTHHLYVVAPDSVNAAIFVFENEDQCSDVKLQFLSAKYICWTKTVDEDPNETNLDLS